MAWRAGTAGSTAHAGWLGKGHAKTPKSSVLQMHERLAGVRRRQIDGNQDVEIVQQAIVDALAAAAVNSEA